MATESATHIFTSLYNFSEVARLEMLRKFKDSNGTVDVQLDSTPKDHFIIRCSKEDKKSPIIFATMLSRYIVTESQKEPDMFDEFKVQRSADTQTEAELDPGEQFPADDAEQEDSDLVDEVDVDSPLIPHETFSRSWSTKRANPTTGAAELIFSTRFLGIIGNLTGCRVELEQDGNTVTAKAESQEQIDRAMSKLDVLDRWAAEKQSCCPRAYDFQYSEGEIGFMLQMSTLKELKDRRLSTTLVPPSFPSIKSLGSYLTVVMIQQGVEFTVIQPPRATKPCLLWKDHVFQFRSEENSNPPKENMTPPSSMVSPTPLANDSVPTQVAMVDQWVKQSATGVLENPFSPSTANPTKEHRGSAPEAIVPPPSERPAPPARKRFAKSRKPMGVGVPVQATTPAPVVDEPTEPKLAVSHEILANVEKDAVSHEEPGSQGLDDAKIHSKEGTASEDSLRGISGPGEGLQSVPSSEQRLDAPPIEPPFMPTETVARTQSESGGSDSSWEKQLVNKGRPIKLIDDSLPRLTVKDRMQAPATDEVQTRQLMHTMNQRKSASGAGKTRGSFVALVRDFESCAISILGLAKNSQGPIKLRAEVGRILINHMSGSAEYKKKPFLPSEWSQVFPAKKGSSKLESLFTNLLTTSPTDAQFVLNLKLDTGRQMFSESPIKRKVTYRFECSTTTDDQIIVEVDERGSYEVLCNKYLIGALNWHFPRRFWDARLTVRSSEQVSNEIRNSIREMVDNLCIHPSLDQKTFDFSTKIDTGDLCIQAITVHRETIHQTAEYKDILLHLMEVQELNLRTQETKVDYRASLPPVPNTTSPGCKIWWEVSLSSVSAADKLKQNDALELGDLASWMPDQVVGNSVADLSYVARDLVERIDAVGSLNKGPKGESGTKTSDKEKPSDVYW
ncbi:hypothetical protein MMC07_007914 [Pseudocyphellaria aurata]|nr:hypothetical protein [Pseudocyphellaria aurata]